MSWRQGEACDPNLSRAHPPLPSLLRPGATPLGEDLPTFEISQGLGSSPETWLGHP